MKRAALTIAILVILAPVCARAGLPVTQSPHGDLKWDCQGCHTSDSWSQMRDSLAFSHDETGFALRGTHSTARCAGCHTELVFSKTSSKCADCHDDTHRGQLGTDCASCHNPYSWLDRDALFDRHAARGFALTGLHAVADCDACHLAQQPRDFASTSPECQSCHSDDFVAVIEPNHVAAGFSGKCESCHQRAADTWTGAVYEHPATFTLIDGHANSTCNACHQEEYAGTPTDCVSCHDVDYTEAADPDHFGSQFSQKCADCHTIVAWSPAEFDHELARFKLTGAHTTADCAGCHAEQYTGTPSDCVACHEGDVLAAADPNHEDAGFPKTCAVCHSTDAWQPSHIDHTLTRFTLTGAHLSVDCSSCHAAGYTGTSAECYACHNDDFASVSDPSHVSNNFSHECTPCHNTAAWLPAEFDHDLTAFPLTGAHSSVECGVCHSGGYDHTSAACFSCHESDYAGAQDPDHAGNAFDHDCTACHTVTAWKPAEFDHNLTDFALTGAHAEATCISCHSAGYTGTPVECFACHESNFNAVADPDHAGSGFDHACAPCHTTTAWKPAEFDHNLARFTLTGAHAATDCNSCHTSSFTGTSMECFACHEQTYNETDNPNHALTGLDHNCALCHTTAAWQPSVFDHDATNFPLTGAHTGAACDRCHSGTATGGLTTECYACHESDYTGTVDPDHVGSQFPTECGVCHTTAAWRPSNLDHNLTSFALTGAHAAVDCNSCHTSGYTGTPSDCYSCHSGDFAGVSDPNHVQAGFDHDCTACHNTDAWLPATFDHNLTSFPLAGAHAATSCISCHANGYTGTPLECFACHEPDYNAAVDPDHAGSGLPHTCGVCHSFEAWRPSHIDHSLTSFPLKGAHVSVDCATCHITGYTGTPSECFACHESDYMAAADPDHAGSGFDHVCDLCHSNTAWKPAGFDHNLADFRLTGAHAAVDCASCHATGFTGTPQDCYACHGEDFAAASDPDHLNNNFDHDCTACHNTDGWTPSTFDHNLTSFRLTGAHTRTLCIDCHGGGYTGTPTECFACHESDFNRTDDPDHVANNFGHTCAACHNTRAWEPADFNHNQTGFPLVGAHLAVDCASCHTNGYTNTASDCIACHESDFNGADDPSHTANNFDHDCTTCHSMNEWTPSVFDHSQTGFALIGAHTSAACIDCHSGGYAATPMACFACHESNFSGTTDPDHLANNFGHICAACHNANAWRPADFNHDQTSFPLLGAHLAVDCITCHTNGYTTTSSDCIACHASDFNGVTDPSHTANNFGHDCTACHGMDGWTPSTFDHNQTAFVLTGAHTSAVCIDCHGGGYAGTPMECFACHESDFNATADPEHVANNFGHICAACHNTSAWRPADFNHNQTGFPLLGAHLAVDCITCHTNGYTTTSSECIACHESDFNGVGDPNHVTNNFEHDCTACHTLNAWTPAAFDHNQTGFVLTGAHTTTACIECHASGYTGTPTECYSCHVRDFNGVDDPNHLQSGFDHVCTQCHTTDSWRPADYDHNLSQFDLIGAHRSVACVQCHAGGYTGTPMECFACHATDYSGVGDPSHVTNNFDHNCLACHSMNGWTPSTFDHNQTGFALTGAHTSAVCIDCHSGGYAGTPMECFACHESNFNGTTDPDHVANNFGHTCAACHNTHAWQPADFNHNQTSFPLVGAHLAVDCITCHTNGYTTTASDCIACHESDFNGVADPSHVTNNFDHDCLACHSMNGWTPSTFDHNQTGFALTGAHTSAVCIDCHSGGYAGTPMQCFACHESNFNGTADPDHVANNFGHTCAACHNTNAWRPADFNHDQTGFPLLGAHLAVDCVTCHTNGYTTTSSDCIACHESDFNGVADPSHTANKFDHDCTACHSMNGWTPSTFDHSQTSFVLTGAHASAVCIDCHSGGYAGTPMECFACHESDFNGAMDPDHVVNKFGHTCAACHNTNAWRPADFNHDQTRFPLVGAHLAVDCIMCHANGYTTTASDCFACHQSDFNGVADPNHVTSGFDHDCTSCHSMNGWTPATIDHNQTVFPLTGAHTTTACIDCHGSGYTGTPTDCYACHSGDFGGVSDPNHVQSGFNHDCTPCHTTNAWQPADYDHNLSQFKLTGAHLAVACALCHTSGYTGTPMECFACHESDYSGVSDPNHVTNNFDHNCLNCHGINGWLPSTFDHGQTGFVLTGAHATTACIGCHGNGYVNTPADCYACHAGDFAGVSDPNHVQGGFNHACGTCHTTDAWQPADYDHDLSQFKLTGAHLAVACAMCHASGYTGTPMDCFACHESDYGGVSNPNHVTNNFDHDCLACHSINGWTPSTFSHDQTNFPLTGAHTTTLCIDCHANGYVGTPMDCFACHESDFNGTTNPNHVANNFGHTCTACHNTAAWQPAEFDHNQTGFPLLGAHLAATCIQCHSAGYTNTPTDCFACHESDYSGVIDPNHVTNNFDHNCLACHSMNGWTPSTFSHNQTNFPLTGAHTTTLCIDCHASGYVGTPMECFACHESDFNGTADPNHVANNFGHICTACHNTSAWRPAEFDHNQTTFPLLGAHLAVNCVSCHAAGYTNTPSDCFACHSSDYNGVSDPSHTANNFGHDCTQCHSMNGWTPATFDHNQTSFPLTGAHAGRACLECHSSGYAGTPTDCYACHASDYNGVSDPNHQQGGYSHDCTQCHSTNGWGSASFDHNLSPFKLTGAHQAVACIQCHSSGYTGTPMDCVACHNSDYLAATNPNHGAAGFPTNCESCHSTNAWTPADWDHDGQYFPIYSGSHRGRWNDCADCHNVPGNFGQFECILCHAHNKSTTDSHHTSVSNYSYVSSACYDCHPTGQSGD